MKKTNAADDGTSYALWYHGASEIYYEFNGGPSEKETINSQDSALVNWMKTIKTAVSKVK